MERAPYPSEGGDELMGYRHIPTPPASDRYAQPGLFELSFLDEVGEPEVVWDVDRALSVDLKRRVQALPDFHTDPANYAEPAFWADIQIPLVSQADRARWCPELEAAIEARLSGRWGFTCLLDGHIRTSFAVDGIDDHSKQMLADFARAVADIFDVDLDLYEAQASITAQTSLRKYPMPGGSAET